MHCIGVDALLSELRRQDWALYVFGPNDGIRARSPRVITMRGELADELANLETRIFRLPAEIRDAEPEERARNPRVLARVLAAVRRL
ncbi:hypothetical protein GCM10025787_25800 [Saccharopolyspora rosea]